MATEPRPEDKAKQKARSIVSTTGCVIPLVSFVTAMLTGGWLSDYYGIEDSVTVGLLMIASAVFGTTMYMVVFSVLFIVVMLIVAKLAHLFL